MSAKLATNDLEAFWMPFTANRQFKKAPRLLVRAEGMHSPDRRRAQGARRHLRPLVRQCRPLPAEDRRGDRASRSASSTTPAPSRWGIRRPSSCASRSSTIAPPGFDHVFFTNSGSESVETALKIALAYHRVKGEGCAHPADRPRARLSRRQFRRHLGRRHRRQPQTVRHAARRRRPPPPHPRPRPQRLHARPAGAWRRACRRPRAARRAARRLDHRRGDRRAGGGLGRRADPAEGLSASGSARSATSTASC